ncbi:exod protein [Lysobacter helvus]|uniref:Exod protein n=2 Tax=Lysobacteraceae TaxID=32033 RepID=A0ABN6FVQ9_9GAMM|nr:MULTISPECIES: exopolysaccharide biosynthesis protein [Lysobacter]BCT93044.1 exod protein [Lysobacter caseinilyticus]BCT96196.1 exod protein [Lysobacter helvus]
MVDPHDTQGDDEAHVRERGIRAILDDLAVGDPNDLLSLRDLLSGLGRRAFGMLLFACVLPAFIPIPIGGAISGPLTILIGLQLCIGMRKPWLPEFLAKRGPHRHALQKFDAKMSPWLAKLEHLIKPRMPQILDLRIASAVTGVLLVLLGILLSLPIPLTNYLFGVLLLAYALALLERDGALMLAAWIAGAIAVVVFGVLSGALVAQATKWIDYLI